MSTLRDFSQAAARRYLQSAVFIDDEIFDKASGMPIEPESLPKPRKPIYVTAPAESLHTTSEDTGTIPAHVPYHPKELVSSFAKEGIICALYEPPEGFDTDPNSEIFKLCERPDILILDWDFSGDNGNKALDLIATLAKQSAQDYPHHTRLLSIYTADPSLVAVANKIADRLVKDGFSADPQDSQCRLQAGATRIVVLGKQFSRIGPDEEAFTVQERDLAGRLIDEFVRMNVGILPSYTLHGLAAIRRNTKRLLDRFHGSLDMAFLLNRKLIVDSEEAFDQLPDLLADELRAIIDDAHRSEINAEKLAEDALNDLPPEAKSLLQRDEKPSKIAKSLLDGSGNAPVEHQRLAALFSNKTHYSGAFRELGYGSIVRCRKDDAGEWSYAFCLVPACDSLRLDPSTEASFPFWCLKVESTAKNKRGMVLRLEKDRMITLISGGRATEMLWMEQFRVDPNTKTVRAIASADGTFRFDCPNRTVEWIGELKIPHAYRIVSDIAAGLSRVGVTEAEWLRLKCNQ